MAAALPEYSPRPSIEIDWKKPLDEADESTLTLTRPRQNSQQLSNLPNASIRLLFSLLERKHVLYVLLPAIFFSVLSGGVAPLMTYVIGQSFNAFAAFSVSPGSPSDSAQLIHDVGFACLELVGLAAAAFVLSGTTSALWIWVGERNVRAVRSVVYRSVVGKEMTWFDTALSQSETDTAATEDGPISAGGLMAKFSRETDEVRMASSLASGYLIQYLTTTIAALVLAFTRAPTLTLVILLAVPLLTVIQILSQKWASPPVAAEQMHSARAASLVERLATAISTVKAFNAETYEAKRMEAIFAKIESAANTSSTVWGVTSGASQFVMMAMFVQSFWFGAQLVRSGQNSAGDVMAVFWACLTATSNLQMCIPQLIVITKGKFAMSGLLALAANPTSIHTNLGITPDKCNGEVVLHDVSFSYPARPDILVLDHVSIYLPAGEMTFIVGGSGSGKSSLAQLMMRLYPATSGLVTLDDQDIQYLAPNFVKHHIAGVSQSCILFDATVAQNVAMGAIGLDEVPTSQIEEACRAALMHEFVRDLPKAYDTPLGTNGAALSGGQKQRLAIARAKLRDPTVLILDEATSALDPTSRILVFEAIKHFRRNKTTIVITHDLSQLTGEDFVYVLRNGSVVEQGFRRDLETSQGEFRTMLNDQMSTGGYLPTKNPDSPTPIPTDEVELPPINEEFDDVFDKPAPVTYGTWMLEAINELTKPVDPVDNPSQDRPHPPPLDIPVRQRRRSSLDSTFFSPTSTAVSVPAPSYQLGKRQSLQFIPSSPPTSATTKFFPDDDIYTQEDKAALQRAAMRAAQRRPSAGTLRHGHQPSASVEVRVDSPVSDEVPQLGFFALMREILPSYPGKFVLFLGLLLAVFSGAMTPVFSFVLSRLMFEVSVGATNVSSINFYGGIVLGAAALDGLLMGLKFFVLEISAMRWITRLRNISIKKISAQDKAWFDDSEHSAVRLMQVIVKDGDDARNLIATVLGQCLVVITMLSVGIIWALVLGWQYSLVGLAFAPVFGICMSVQAGLVTKCELRNKRAREEVAKGYFEAISNIRAIRAMSFEKIFQTNFDKAADSALKSGVSGAFVEGATYGVATALIYLAEALLFFVGAQLLAHKTYTYLQMVQVLNLLVFSVSIGSQLMAFTERIAKSMQAARDFNEILKMTTVSDEAHGSQRPAMAGAIRFHKVSFSYPERPDVPVLKRMSLKVSEGECVAVVGASGSGKSTIAALLQRLYEPQAGSISVDGFPFDCIDVHHLRDHISIVSQTPNLFDATISDNIRYGHPTLTMMDIRRAAKAANVHEFIMSLPQGYETMIGDNASLISGGQAQRIQLARALARPSKILILDECTSALDSANQAAILETIRSAKVGRTTMMVTHKLAVMQMCDRIVVIDDGRVAEQGTYAELVARKGIFADLASGGEWQGN